tara:strand:+ start:4460 stop:4966 length:507 start_codon:yes stop_codon:yes gene_type:complete
MEDRSKGKSLWQARTELLEDIEDGATCPCCGQLAKVYRRKLNKEMAKWLVWLVAKYLSSSGHIPSVWIDVKDSKVRGGDYAKLALWGLAKRKPVEEGSKSRTSGLWQPTAAGIDFALGRKRVPSHLYVYNNAVVRESEVKISVKDALGEGFDYQDVYYWNKGEELRTP